MATATKGKATPAKVAAATKPAAKPAAVEVEETAEAEPVFGVADVAALIQVNTGKVVKTRDLRTLLRKMARDGRLDREIIAGNRERWTWSGPDHPEVDKIIEAFSSGELDQDKKEKLDALKQRKADQRAAKKAEEEAAAAAEPASDDEELVEE